jgi:hypothetical protein
MAQQNIQARKYKKIFRLGIVNKNILVMLLSINYLNGRAKNNS